MHSLRKALRREDPRHYPSARPPIPCQTQVPRDIEWLAQQVPLFLDSGPTRAPPPCTTPSASCYKTTSRRDNSQTPSACWKNYKLGPGTSVPKNSPLPSASSPFCRKWALLRKALS